MPTSEQLAREARATREKLSRTLDELRVRAAPSNLVDEVSGYLQRATGPFLSDEAPRRTRYTLPLALVGAGLAWLAVQARTEHTRRERVRTLAEAARAEAAARAAAAGDQSLPAVPEHGHSLAPINGAEKDQQSLRL